MTNDLNKSFASDHEADYSDSEGETALSDFFLKLDTHQGHLLHLQKDLTGKNLLVYCKGFLEKSHFKKYAKSI